MKILATKTPPPSSPIAGRHTPKQGDYTTYRDCLRWDFSFTCGFCLLHEAEIVLGGIRGTGSTTIEHVKRKQRGCFPELRNEIPNLVYACRFCNSARGKKRWKHRSGAVLLNPREVAWSQHFYRVGDELRPISGDRDALYTFDVYRLNDARKIKRREIRRNLIESRLGLLRDGPGWARKLRALAKVENDTGKRSFLIQQAQERRQEVRKAWEELRFFRAVPSDAPTSCRCKTTEHHTVGAFVPVVNVEQPTAD